MNKSLTNVAQYRRGFCRYKRSRLVKKAKCVRRRLQTTHDFAFLTRRRGVALAPPIPPRTPTTSGPSKTDGAATHRPAGKAESAANKPTDRHRQRHLNPQARPRRHRPPQERRQRHRRQRRRPRHKPTHQRQPATSPPRPPTGTTRATRHNKATNTPPTPHRQQDDTARRRKPEPQPTQRRHGHPQPPARVSRRTAPTRRSPPPTTSRPQPPQPTSTGRTRAKTNRDRAEHRTISAQPRDRNSKQRSTHSKHPQQSKPTTEPADAARAPSLLYLCVSLSSGNDADNHGWHRGFTR